MTMATTNTTPQSTSKVLDDLLAQLSLDFDLANTTANSSPVHSSTPTPTPRATTPQKDEVDDTPKDIPFTMTEFDWSELHAMAHEIDDLLDDTTPLHHPHPHPPKRNKRLSRVLLSSSFSPSPLKLPTLPALAHAHTHAHAHGRDLDDDDDQTPIATTLSRSTTLSSARTATAPASHPPLSSTHLVAPAAESSKPRSRSKSQTPPSNRNRHRRQSSPSPSPAGPGPAPPALAAAAAEKLAKAKIQKLHTKVLIGAHPESQLTQPISVASITPAIDILDYLADTLDLSTMDPAASPSSDMVEPVLASPADNNDGDNDDNTQDADAPAYSLYESFADLSLVRPLRPWEPLGDVLRSWEPAGSRNALWMRLDPFARLPEYALLGPAAPFSGVLHWESRPGHFKKRLVELRLGAESRRHVRSEFAAPGTLTGAIDVVQSTEVASVWMGRAKSKSASPDVLVCSLAHFDVYTLDPAAPARKRAPTAYGFALKNAAARMAQFEEKSEYVHWFYADSPLAVRAWVMALRACKAHVDRFLHREWFDDEDEDDDEDANAAVADTKSAHMSDNKSHHSAAAAAPPMFHTLLNLDADTKPAAARAPPDDGGPLLRDVSAPTSSIPHGTTVTPLGPNGKPLLDFTDSLAGFTLERPTLLGSTLSRSKTIATSPSHGTRQIGGTLGAAAGTLHRSASESHHTGATLARSRSRGSGSRPAAPPARASPGGSPTLGHRRTHSPQAKRSGGGADTASRGDHDSDDSDDELPLGTLARRPTLQGSTGGASGGGSPYLMPLQLPVGGGGAAHPGPTAASTAAASLARQRSVSRPRPAAAAAAASPAAGAHLGGALDESNVGGKGTLLDQIGRRRNEVAAAGGAAGQRRGLIDQIPSARNAGGRW